MLGDPITELTIAMETGYFQLNRAEYFVPLSVKIPGQELALAKRGGHERTSIDFIGEVKDEFGTTVTNVRDRVEIKLSEAAAAELARRPIEYETGFTLLPGRYQIKFLAHDAETGRIGTSQIAFVVPNLNKETKRIPVSSPVLSSQRIALDGALYTAQKGQKGREAMAANPLVQDGQKLIPSVTRVFRRSREMFIYVEAYEPGAVATRPVHAWVSFYRGDSKALETKAIAAAGALGRRLKTVPLRFHVPLGDLAPGEYLCQISVLDGGDGKAAFLRVPVMVVD